MPKNNEEETEMVKPDPVIVLRSGPSPKPKPKCKRCFGRGYTGWIVENQDNGLGRKTPVGCRCVERH